MGTRRRLGRLHIWLGWLIGVPLLLWTGSGLWMAARPIDEVRGTALRRPVAALVLPAVLVPPDGGGRPVRSLQVEPAPAGPVWILGYADGGAARASLSDGRLLPPLSAAEAVAVARAAYLPPTAVERATRYPADAPPVDLRQARPSWQVRFADGTNLYVDADSGRVLALRTRQWRWFDVMWGLHIMDVQTREDTSHPLLIGFAALAFLGVLLGVVLLPWRRSRRQLPPR